VRPFLLHRQRKKIAKAIASGQFQTEPAEVAHFVDYERAGPGRQIPKIFHQTWRSTELPVYFRGNRQRVLDLHPSPPWQHQFWTDDEINRFVAGNFPQYWDAFQRLPRMIMRVDMFRYMALAVYGGVYADLDFRMFKPIDDMIADCALLLPGENDDYTQENFIGQHVLASCPGHEFWYDILKECLDQPAEVIARYEEPLDTTGPYFVTRMWRRHYQSYGAKIPMRIFLATPTDDFSGMTMPEESYGVHECSGTWR
jgi:mannosyltransferase OCH1-like enzyme